MPDDLITPEKQTSIATDFLANRSDIHCIPETRTEAITCKGEEVIQLRLYNTGTEEGSHHGVGILIEKSKE